MARRALHLVDVENLTGGPRPGEMSVASALNLYRRAVPVGPDDQVVIAANGRTALAAKWAWPEVLVRIGWGPDGADVALLAESRSDYVAPRFERVVVASGDHAFAPRVAELRAAGVAVEVVARPGCLAGRLRAVADVVRILPDLDPPALAV